MALEANIKLTTMSLDAGRFSKALKEAVLVQMRGAARAYVRIASAAVPFRTGFARGIFRNILQEVGASGGNLTRPDPASTQPFGNPLKSLRILKKHGNKFVRIDKFPNIASIFRLDARSLRRAGVKQGGVKHIPGTDVRLEYYRSGSQKILKTPQSGRAFASPPGSIIQEVNFTFRFRFSTLSVISLRTTLREIKDIRHGVHSPKAKLSFYSI